MLQALYDIPTDPATQAPKDSWLGIAVVFLGGTALLLGSAYYNLRRHQRQGAKAKRFFVVSHRNRS